MITGGKEKAYFLLKIRVFFEVFFSLLVAGLKLELPLLHCCLRRCFFILEKLTQIAEKHTNITQSSDPPARSKITDGLHANVIPVTVKQDGGMFFLSSV